jgi:RNA-directed DNA polymerase
VPYVKSRIVDLSPGTARRIGLGKKQGVTNVEVAPIAFSDAPAPLERAKETTRNGQYTYIEYARYADDLVVLIDAFQRHDWLLTAVMKRLREEFAKLDGEIK